MNFWKRKDKSNNKTRQIVFVDGVAKFVDNGINAENSVDNLKSNEVSGNNQVCESSRTKKLYKNKNKIKSILLSAVFLVFIFVAPFFFEKAGINYPSQISADTTFLKVWHIDSFEGGSGNRADFIEKMAMNYHKINSNVYIVVQTLSEEELESTIKNGDRADIISFSHHTANIFNNLLQPLDVSVNVRDDLLSFAQNDGETYAVPWNMSGYCLIGNSAVDSRVLETLDFNSAYSFNGGQYNYIAGLKDSYAQVAMSYNSNAKCDLTLCDSEIFNKTSYQAYCDFVENKGAVLLGTARDFYRVKNRVSLGNMAQCKFLPLGKFTDLIQYMGVLSSQNQVVAESFIEYMVSGDVQKSLCDIGLFSVCKMKIYSDEDYKAFEDKLNMTVDSISIFASEDYKQKLYADAINKLK